ncbi:thiol-disulfide isomerase [Pseudomonas sp. HMWF032]|nr:thiol-disulfide isomerase [Pseudomonas sp. HMWF032]PTT84974.1 thiol-disulfide isomerase [Pseudomonas sp. HMWF010]
MTRPTRKTLLASLLILLWAAAMLAAYRWYESRYLRSFSEQTALFYGEQLRLPDELAGPGPIRLVHFWDPACPCNVGNQQHLAELIERFASQGVNFYAVQKPGSSGQLPSTLSALQPLAELTGSTQIPASPAVAIWDRTGQLAYFGPYSEGAVCTSSNSFIEPILDALIEERPVSASNTLAVGCFCEWQNN